MKKLMTAIAATLLVHFPAAASSFLIVTSSATAETQIDIDYDTQSFEDKKLISDLVKVSVSYNKQKNIEPDVKNFHYQIFYNGILRVKFSDFVASSSVSLKDLDGNKVPEVIVKTFSGGAHCCTNYTLYTWQGKQFFKTETGPLDGGGGSFEDLDKDGKLEFVTRDNSFFYAFDSYAGSYPPSQIYTFNNGKLENVTRRHVRFLRSQLQKIYQAFLESKKEGHGANGILAGYVAQKALLGEFQQGWKFMLANYDRTSDWGLAIYQGDREVSRYPNFPTALKAFLIKQSYLDRNGRPLINRNLYSDPK